MTEPLISIAVDGSGRVFTPGETLRGEFQIDAVDPGELQSVEVSVLWHSEGKGDEDLGVHYFQRFTDAEHFQTLHELKTFATQLPNSPLSYDGLILKIRWCARVRVFMTRGRQLVCDQPFQLGNVPRPPVLGRTGNQETTNVGSLND